MVAEAVKTAKPGEWILGRGWHQEKWTAPPTPNVEGFPTHASLDACRRTIPSSSRTPAATPASSTRKAMELSGITRTTPNPAGGEILKDASGEPTGLLRETASELDHGTGVDARPSSSRATARSSSSPIAEALSKGITTFQDAGSSFATIDLMKQMVDEGAHGRAAVGDGARGQRGGGAAARASTG